MLNVFIDTFTQISEKETEKMRDYFRDIVKCNIWSIITYKL